MSRRWPTASANGRARQKTDSHAQSLTPARAYNDHLKDRRRYVVWRVVRPGGGIDVGHGVCAAEVAGGFFPVRVDVWTLRGLRADLAGAAGAAPRRLVVSADARRLLGAAALRPGWQCRLLPAAVVWRATGRCIGCFVDYRPAAVDDFDAGPARSRLGVAARAGLAAGAGSGGHGVHQRRSIRQPARTCRMADRGDRDVVRRWRAAQLDLVCRR